MSNQHRPAHFSSIREDLQAALLEFVGTTFFLLLGLGGIQATTSEAASPGGSSSTIEHVMYISTCMGLSLLVSAWLFFRITGGLFNPNVSLALMLIGVIKPVRFVLYCIAQLLGAIAASALIMALTPGPLSVNTFLQKNVNIAQGVFIEMFITAALIVAVLMLAAEKHQVTPFAPVGIGLTLFAGHLWAVFYTGASMNTARSFGPAVVTGFPDPQHWVYWVGPCLGSFLAAGFYSLLHHYKYWLLNPDQATVDESLSPQDVKPIHIVKRAMIFPDSIITATAGAANAFGIGGSERADRKGSDTTLQANDLAPQAEDFKIEDLAHEDDCDSAESSSTRRMRMTFAETMKMEYHTALDGIGNAAELENALGPLSAWTEMTLPEVLGTARDIWKNDSPV